MHTQDLGGAVLVQSSNAAMSYNTFLSNMAAVGGAVALVGGSHLDVDQPWWVGLDLARQCALCA